MRVLITGASGFVGGHLARHLSHQGHEVLGISRSALAPNTSAAFAATFCADVRDVDTLRRVISDVRPEAIVHLAAQSSVGASFADVDDTYAVNLLGSVHLFAAVHQAVPRTRILWVGSSDEYGAVDAKDIPVSESVPLRPISPYGVSKAAADLAAYQWTRRYGMDIVRVRPFNSTGPGQAPRFICADFARQIVAAERRDEPAVVQAGALDVVRDFLDVRDMVAALAEVLAKGASGDVYNVCSGVGRTPRQVAESLLAVSRHGGRVEVSAQRLRPAEIPVLLGSAAKLQAVSRWQPRIAWEQTLADVLDDWRSR